MEDLKGKTLSGLIFKFLERCGAQTISFIVTIVLARILTPDEYGVIAIVLTIILICDVFVTYGFGNSLVVNKKSDDIDFSTCFYFSIVLSLLVYMVVYFSAPFIANYFGYPILTPLVRVMGLRIPIAAINSIQEAYVSKHMLFKKFFYATLLGASISGVLSILLAYKGFGVWALAFQNLCNMTINAVALWFFVKWRPIRAFSMYRLRAIYDYGWKILVVGLIDRIYSQLRNIVIAKKYTSSDLAYYSKGDQFPGLAINIIEPTLGAVIFPALSQCNDNMIQMKSAIRRITKSSMYLITPVIVFLACAASSIVEVLLTAKWLSCVIYLQISCLAYILTPLQVINGCVIRASGKSGLLLKLDITKKSIGIILLFLSLQYGPLGVVFSFFLTNVVSTLINIFPNRKLLGYGYKEQMMDIAPGLLVSAISGVVIYMVTFLRMNIYCMLILEICIFCAVFLVISIVFRVESYEYIRNIIIDKLKTLRK